MSMKFALGLAFGQKMAESAGVADIDARRRAGIVLGAVGLTPVGFLVTKTMIDRQADIERERDQDAEGEGSAGGDVEGRRAGSASGAASSGSSASGGGKAKS